MEHLFGYESDIQEIDHCALSCSNVCTRGCKGCRDSCQGGCMETCQGRNN